VFDVSRCVDERHGQSIYSQLQCWRVGAVGATSDDLLFDLYRVEALQGQRITRMPEDNPLALDVEKRTTRGRLCPRCGGKIIPSNRAVYQSGADPTGSFPIWQCERCGYEEMGERRKPAGKAKH
jgi:ribosomal protein S27AE